MMGVCFDCLAEIDGVANRQSCMVAARPGMRIRRQRGARPPFPPPLSGGGSEMTVDLAIVGAGPAGMAAAALAAELGLDTARRSTSRTRPAARSTAPSSAPGRARRSARDYLAGQTLVGGLRASRARYRPAHDGVAHRPGAPTARCRSPPTGASETVDARHILLATGAIERPVPIPGWTLPGVMTAGAAQILLKTADLVPEGPGGAGRAGAAPLSRSPPQLARAGAPPVAVLETTPRANYRAAAAPCSAAVWPGAADAAARDLADARGLRRAGIPVRRGVRGLRALGRDRVDGVAWDGGEIAADHLFLHEGVIPNTQISLGLAIARIEWDEAQLCWRPVARRLGPHQPRRTSPSPAMAAASLGAAAAALSGRLAALDAAARSAISTRPSATAAPGRSAPRSTASARSRPFLDALYRPPTWVLVPADDAVIACRCEEVSVGQIRRAVRLGATGPNQVKAFTRCGMGPCQGRICGPDRRRRHRRCARRADRRNRHLSPARPLQADHGRRPRRYGGWMRIEPDLILRIG